MGYEAHKDFLGSAASNPLDHRLYGVSDDQVARLEGRKGQL